MSSYVFVPCAGCRTTSRVVGPRDGMRLLCPRCGTQFTFRSPVQREGSSTFWGVLGTVAITALAYKVVQAACDEDFGRGEFPRWFRDEKRREHVALHGPRCPGCGRRTSTRQLTVDHIVAMRNGGLTSRANAAILCRRCNSRKGAANSVFDYFRGRST